MAACRTADAASVDARAAYLAVVVLVHFPLSARRGVLGVEAGFGSEHFVSPLLLFNQGFVDHGNPARRIAVKLELGSIVVHSDVLVVEPGKRDALILVEFFRVGRKRQVLGFLCHCVEIWREIMCRKRVARQQGSDRIDRGFTDALKRKMTLRFNNSPQLPI